jgi:peroxiredoxin
MITQLLSLSFALSIPALAQACEAPKDTRARLTAAPVFEDVGSIELQRLDGSAATLRELVPGFARGEVVVLSMTEVGCPIAGKLAPRVERLSNEFRARGVRFVGIDSSAQDSLAEIAHESNEFNRTFPVLKDPRQELARALGVRTTTETFVFDGRGRLCYRGAVDDQYALGAARPEPVNDYLVQALHAVLKGEETALAATEAPGCLLTLLPASELSAAPTYSKDVAPILRSRCEACHRPGQVGPFALQKYEDVKGRAKMIASVLEDGIMPPWNADARFDGVFVNERKIRASEKEIVLRWIAEGMPRGNPSEDPAPAKWPEGWSIGTPDVVLTPEIDALNGKPLPKEGYAVPREGVVEYQHFTLKTSYPEDRWIQALEVKPGAADVVHHVLVAIQDANGDINEETYLAVYVPGDTPSVYPKGYAKRLPAGATLVFQLHFTPNGKERRDRSSMALVFAKEAPDFEVVTDAVINKSFSIPPGAENHEVRAERTLKDDVGLVGLFPHMHKRGKDFRYVAHLPDGTTQELLYSHYDFAWQESYLLPDPMFLPAGTKIECVGHFDNSSGNPNNPDPKAAVQWGPQTFEEMFIGYFDTVVAVQ